MAFARKDFFFPGQTDSRKCRGDRPIQQKDPAVLPPYRRPISQVFLGTYKTHTISTTDPQCRTGPFLSFRHFLLLRSICSCCASQIPLSFMFFFFFSRFLSLLSSSNGRRSCRRPTEILMIEDVVVAVVVRESFNSGRSYMEVGALSVLAQEKKERHTHQEENK